jgi:hypothetical protein
VKKIHAYTLGTLKCNKVADRESYINADTEYKAADSAIISAAKWGCFTAPGTQDIRTMRVTIIMVEVVVVAADNATREISGALKICSGIQAGHTWNAKATRPAADSNVRL